MCELFAVSSAKKIYLNDYLNEFRAHSHHHPHGWGAAFFEGNVDSSDDDSCLGTFDSLPPHIIKEPLPAHESELYASLLEKPIEEKIFLAHIRLATVGSLTYENCHPFLLADESGRHWTVSHNGTIFHSDLLEKYKDMQLGSTDSERVALHILESANALLRECCGLVDSRANFEMMDKIILKLAPENKLNLMVYDGELLYIHTNMAGTLFYKNIESGIVFATSPLDNETWTPVPMMQLFAYKDGELVYSGTKHNHEYFLKPEHNLYLSATPNFSDNAS